MMVNSDVKKIIEKMLNDDRNVVNGQPETIGLFLLITKSSLEQSLFQCIIAKLMKKIGTTL